MASELVELYEKPSAQYMIAGWNPQWSDGGEISSGLPQYLIEKLGARKIGEMSKSISTMCFPFQVPGTHDAFRPAVVYQDGLPSKEIFRENCFYDAGNGLIIFLGEEPWFRIDMYGEAFFHAIRELGIVRTVAVEGYNGPSPPELERSINSSYRSLSHRPVGELSNTGVGAMGLKRGRPVQFHRPLVSPQKGRLRLLVPWGQGPAPRGLATAP